MDRSTSPLLFLKDLRASLAATCSRISECKTLILAMASHAISSIDVLIGLLGFNGPFPVKLCLKYSYNYDEKFTFKDPPQRLSTLVGVSLLCHWAFEVLIFVEVR